MRPVKRGLNFSALRRLPEGLRDREIFDFGHIGTSVDPSSYRQGGFYDKPGCRIVPPQNVLHTRIEFPRYQYARPLPILVDAEDTEADVIAECTRQIEKCHTGPPVINAAMRDVLTIGSVLYEVREDSLVAVWETCRENDRTVQRSADRQALKQTRFAAGGTDHVLLSSPGSSNFGHWLVDDMARLTMHPSDVPTTYILNAHNLLIDQRREECLRLAAGSKDCEVLFVDPTRPIYWSRVRFCTPPSYHPSLKCPAALSTLRDRFLFKSAEDGPRLVYLSRRGVERRGLLNQPEIDSILERAGFVTVDPVASSAEEQARACANAEVIVGVMGAAMTNTLFAPPGATVVQLAPRGWLETFYWDLAAARGHDYVAIYGPSEGGGDVWTRSFRVDGTSLRTVLRSLGI